MFKLGNIRSNQPGSHQFLSPSNCMVDGTSNMRTIEASINSAEARPRPNSLMIQTEQLDDAVVFEHEIAKHRE